MNTTLFLAECGDLLDNDAQKTRFPDAMLIRTANRQLRGLFRTLVQSNKEYSNFLLGAFKANAVEVVDNVFEYKLPTWVTHVVKVWQRQNDPAVATTFSPYLWTGAASVQPGAEIQKFVGNSFEQYWSWEGNHTLRLNKQTQPLDLLIEVAARPAPMFKGVISTLHASTSKLYLPAALTYGEVELEEGSFINSEIECTGTVVNTSTNLGLVRRCIYSNAATINAGARLHELSFDTPWASGLAIGDTVESIVPLPDEHCRLLVLKVAQAAFGRKPNVDAMRIISGEMADEMGKFMAYASTPRDKQGPSFIRQSSRSRPPYNADYPAWGWN